VAAEDFYALLPERVLVACEGGGRRATGRVMALNSLENRVYEVELEEGAPLVAKFYRPGRWSVAALADEHRFLAELAEAEVPVVPPLPVEGPTAGGVATLGLTPEGIHYALFPKVRGRVPEELDDDQLAQVGRLLGRVHNVGAARAADDRPRLDAAYYARRSLKVLAQTGVVPPDLWPRLEAVGDAIAAAAEAAWPAGGDLRLHGDCHLGNLLWAPSGFFFVDFDDFLHGPPVQDLWLVAPGHDEEDQRRRRLVAEAYDTMRGFDFASLRLVEALRGLRILRYAAWIAERWQDPAFARAFPAYLERATWQRELALLEEQHARILRALG
jgi:Ser/Thr protein kinase RdoA (MazF antagonist)